MSSYWTRKPRPDQPLRHYDADDMARNPSGWRGQERDQGAALLAREVHGVELYEWRRRQMRAKSSPRGR